MGAIRLLALAMAFVLCGCKPSPTPPEVPDAPTEADSPAEPLGLAASAAAVVSAPGEVEAAVSTPPLSPPESALTESERLVIAIEPAFMRPPVARPFGGGREAVLTLGILGADNTLRHGETGSAPAADAAWGALLAATLAEAGRLIEAAEPSYHRGRDGVIQYAWLEIDHPLAPMAVLTPEFLAMFRETLGTTVHVVIPARRLIYAFPALASNLEMYGPKFVRAYEGAVTPISLEVYEIGEEGVRAIGTFRPD